MRSIFSNISTDGDMNITNGSAVSPPVKSVWEFSNDKIKGKAHFSRFPEELPARCIDAYGRSGLDVTVFDPFAGSGTTCIAAKKAGCSHLGFEIDPEQCSAANERIETTTPQVSLKMAGHSDSAPTCHG